MRGVHNIEGRLDQHLGGLTLHFDIPGADVNICVLIDGHALIQSLGKPRGYQYIYNLADVYMHIASPYFGEHITRVDVVFDRYIR